MYKGKKIMVTGHTGFKGAWLAIWLEWLGADVVGIALDPKHDRGVFALSGIGQRMTDYRFDIMDAEKLQKVFANEKPEMVFHLAAQALVLESYRNPKETFAVNVLGTVNVLEAIRRTPSVRGAVLVTSDKCYSNREWIYGYREIDPLGGFDPYSASKGAAEIVIESYRNSFFHQPKAPGIASARAGNVIGGGDWAENRLIPDLMRALEAGEPLKIRKPLAVRPWQHVLEPLSGYLLLGEKLQDHPRRFASAWNFGPQSSHVLTVRELIDRLLVQMGQGTWEDVSGNNHEHEANLLMLDINKAQRALGWRPTLSVEQTLAFTSEWYQRAGTDNVLDLCYRQIESFVEQHAKLHRNSNFKGMVAASVPE